MNEAQIEAYWQTFLDSLPTFAYEEGEGDRSLSYWREAHWRFFSRTLPQIGKQSAEVMPLVCERFQLIHP